MAQMSVTLNDVEGYFSYLTLLTHFWGNMTRIKLACENRRAYVACDLEWAWMSFISFRAFQRQVVYICAAQQFTRFLLARPRRAVPQRQLGFLWCIRVSIVLWSAYSCYILWRLMHDIDNIPQNFIVSQLARQYKLLCNGQVNGKCSSDHSNQWNKFDET